MRVADIWEKLYPLVVRLIKDMMTGGSGGSSISIPVISAFWAYLPDLKLGIGDQGIYSMKLPINWDSSTDMTLRFRWKIAEAYAVNNGEVNFEFTQGAAGLGEVQTDEAPVESGDIDIPATQSAIAETSWTIDGSVFTAGDCLFFSLQRVSINDGNDPLTDIVVLTLDLEYTAN
jgi:hypothetical protein